MRQRLEVHALLSLKMRSSEPRCQPLWRSKAAYLGFLVTVRCGASLHPLAFCNASRVGGVIKMNRHRSIPSCCKSDCDTLGWFGPVWVGWFESLKTCLQTAPRARHATQGIIQASTGYSTILGRLFGLLCSDTTLLPTLLLPEPCGCRQIMPAVHHHHTSLRAKSQFMSTIQARKSFHCAQRCDSGRDIGTLHRCKNVTATILTGGVTIDKQRGRSFQKRWL
ncbi:hypothetical protein BU16DRAFT_318121 [Lophium mytilinum]|uniref:Uncharacterized protein n=1 Tax=Lophium mytilinum TaxID=390894 RepID=A0A6A6R167_9PEZI|nr:hypothetical protein BU16DRAFT_318121 [Lophium mytilinum]